jgi:iron complex outermembrane receptor protein
VHTGTVLVKSIKTPRRSSHNHNGLSTTATLQNSAASIAVINRTDLNKGDGVILTSVLNKIPGVYMQQGALNTNRISIRGIGSRAQYGTQKIKRIMKGFL